MNQQNLVKETTAQRILQLIILLIAFSIPVAVITETLTSKPETRITEIVKSTQITSGFVDSVMTISYLDSSIVRDTVSYREIVKKVTPKKKKSKQSPAWYGYNHNNTMPNYYNDNMPMISVGSGFNDPMPTYSVDYGTYKSISIDTSAWHHNDWIWPDDGSSHSVTSGNDTTTIFGIYINTLSNPTVLSYNLNDSTVYISNGKLVPIDSFGTYKIVFDTLKTP